jgi:hypothetical protein
VLLTETAENTNFERNKYTSKDSENNNFSTNAGSRLAVRSPPRFGSHQSERLDEYGMKIRRQSSIAALGERELTLQSVRKTPGCSRRLSPVVPSEEDCGKLMLCIKSRRYRLRKNRCFVSGHDFNRAAQAEKMIGFRICVRTGKLQVPPLRFAAVGMTRLGPVAQVDRRYHLENATSTLSSRPQRSGVEGPAVCQPLDGSHEEISLSRRLSSPCQSPC